MPRARQFGLRGEIMAANENINLKNENQPHNSGTNLPEQRGKEKRPGFCPKCGAYSGAFYRCPVCRTKMPHGTRLRFMQVAIILGAISGLVVLGFFARINPAPLVNIGDIGPTYSNGSVTIKGNITGIDFQVANDNSWRTLIFTVNDSTGAIDVKAYTETADEMIAAHNTPAIGDQCSVRGSVYVKGTDLYLLLEASAYFQPSRPLDFTLNATTLATLYNATPADYLNKRAKVNGTVTYVGADGSYFDLDDVIRVYFPDYVRQFSPSTSISVIAGDIVWVTGLVAEYYSSMELLPATMFEIEITYHGGASPE